MFCSSKLFVLFGERSLIGLIALVFLSFFILLLNLQTLSAASRDNVFVLIAQKIDNEPLKAFQQNSFSPTVCGSLLVNINSIQRERRGLSRRVCLSSVHQVISDNRRLWDPGHPGGGERHGQMETQPSGDLNDFMCSKCDYWKVRGYTVST